MLLVDLVRKVRMQLVVVVMLLVRKLVIELERLWIEWVWTFLVELVRMLLVGLV